MEEETFKKYYINYVFKNDELNSFDDVFDYGLKLDNNSLFNNSHEETIDDLELRSKIIEEYSLESFLNLILDDGDIAVTVAFYKNAIDKKHFLPIPLISKDNKIAANFIYSIYQKYKNNIMYLNPNYDPFDYRADYFTKEQLDIMKEIDAYKGLINNEKEKVRKRV